MVSRASSWSMMGDELLLGDLTMRWVRRGVEEGLNNAGKGYREVLQNRILGCRGLSGVTNWRKSMTR